MITLIPVTIFALVLMNPFILPDSGIATLYNGAITTGAGITGDRLELKALAPEKQGAMTLTLKLQRNLRDGDRSGSQLGGPGMIQLNPQPEPPGGIATGKRTYKPKIKEPGSLEIPNLK